MVKVNTEIKTQAGMSNTTYHRRCTAGQRNWWLKNEAANKFVEIGFHRGDQPLAILLELEPGVYRLGTGPAGRFGHREIIEVLEKS